MDTFDGLAVSSKFAICGLPIRADSYRTCSFGCLYCFANARKIMEFRKELAVADVAAVERRLDRISRGGRKEADFLDWLLSKRVTWHYGGMSDPFQPVEKELGITSEIVSIANNYGHKILFSTKSNTVYKTPIRPDLHTFQLSVTSTQEQTEWEPNVPAFSKRKAFFDELKSEGFKVGIRIQPFIPGVSSVDIVREFPGASHFIVEGLKMVPQNEDQKAELIRMFGLKESDFTQKGLLTLEPEIRYKLYQPIVKYFEEHGLSYSISDNDMRWLGNNYCCCGDALVDGGATGFDVTAMQKKYGGKYFLKDVLREVDCFGCGDCKCSDLFTSNRTNGCKTVRDFYKERFKKASSPFSPNFQYIHNYELF